MNQPDHSNHDAGAIRLADLREKAERLADVAEHLRRRQARLRWLRKAQRHGRARPESSMSAKHELLEQHAARMRGMEQQRQELSELRSKLDLAERRMVRRWACQHALMGVGWVLIIAVIAAGIGWVAAGRFMPPTRSASVVIKAKSRARAPMSPEQKANWQVWHTSVLSDDAFHAVLAKRLDERRLDAYALPSVIGDRLARDLAIDANEPDRLVLTLAGSDTAVLTAILDIVATTVASESSRQIGKRTDATFAVVLGERKEGGLVRYATMNDVLLRDDRLIAMGAVGSLLFAIMLVAVGLVYRRLRQVRREFDEDGTLFIAAQTSSGYEQSVATIHRIAS